MTIENNSEFPAHVCLAILIFDTDKCAWKTYKLLYQKIIQMFNSAILIRNVDECEWKTYKLAY